MLILPEVQGFLLKPADQHPGRVEVFAALADETLAMGDNRDVGPNAQRGLEYPLRFLQLSAADAN